MNINESQFTNSQLPIIQITQQDIDVLFNKIISLPHTQQEYENALAKWNEFNEQRIESMIKWREVLEEKQKQTKSYLASNICIVCYEELGSKKNWCRVCGMECCEKCIGRYRVINKGNAEQKQKQENENENGAVPCCLICDEKYLNALVELQHQKQIQLRRKVLEKVQKLGSSSNDQIQQVSISDNDSILKSSPIRIKKSIKQLIQTTTELSSMNQSIKLQTLQTKKKISWGEDIRKKLSTKYNKMKSKLNRSFNSSVNNEQSIIPPPKVYDLDMNKSEVNQSTIAINSVIQDDTRMIHKGKCCKACPIM